MKKLLIIPLTLWSLNGKAQDTLKATIYYSDTCCKYDRGDVASMFNCLKRDTGYIVFDMYIIQILTKCKKPFSKQYEIWNYKLKQ